MSEDDRLPRKAITYEQLLDCQRGGRWEVPGIWRKLPSIPDVAALEKELAETMELLEYADRLRREAIEEATDAITELKAQLQWPCDWPYPCGCGRCREIKELNAELEEMRKDRNELLHYLNQVPSSRPSEKKAGDKA